MTSAAVTLHPLPSTGPDPVLRQALTDLLHQSGTAGRVAARLLEVEEGALTVLADAAIEAARLIVAAPASLAAAIDAGHMAEASDVARDAIVARVVALAKTQDKASRAVRRTVALIMRLDEGRPPRAPRPAALHPVVHAPDVPDVPDRDPPEYDPPDRDPAEPRDDADLDSEIRGMTDQQAIRAICRDVDADPAPYLALLPTPASPQPASSSPLDVSPAPHAGTGAPHAPRALSPAWAESPAWADTRTGPAAAPNPDG